MSCPVCRGSFREVLREGILIDVCTQCRGVWLDRGELEKLLALARDEGAIEAPPQRPAAPPPQQPVYQQPPQPQYREQERYSRRDDDDDDDDKRKYYAQHGQHGAPYRKKKKGFDFLDIFEFGD
nr:zf-TFIIB domain-containing protein [Asticcacaulis sp. AC402]